MAQTATSTKLSWREALARQDWAHIIAHIIIIIPALVAVSQVLGNPPASRPFLLSDATISLPYLGASSIPFWVVPVVPLVSIIFTSFILEGFNARLGLISSTTALAAGIFWFLEFSLSQATTALLTDTFKVVVGGHRPDWLDRCNPAAPAEPSVPTWGLSASSNPACDSTLSESKLDDGQKSFPSGHASSAFAGAVFLSGYVLFSIFYRPARKFVGWAKRQQQRKLSRRVLAELGGLVAFIWILFQISWAWAVAASRIIDNKHHPSDVVGGGLLGAMVASVYFARAIPRHLMVSADYCCDEQDDDDAGNGANCGGAATGQGRRRADSSLLLHQGNAAAGGGGDGSEASGEGIAGGVLPA